MKRGGEPDRFPSDGMVGYQQQRRAELEAGGERATGIEVRPGGWTDKHLNLTVFVNGQKDERL